MPSAMHEHRFKVGSNYENERGPFRVLAIKGDDMLIEWDGGEQRATKVGLQERILTRMEKEASESKAGKSRTSPDWMGKSFAGLLQLDFKDDVEGTHWRSREQLGGAVTRLIDARDPMNSWSIYRRPQIHWASISRYGTGEAWLDAKFFIRIQPETGLYGFYVERTNEPENARVDWLNLLNWLAVEDHVDWLHHMIQQQGMRIFDPYPHLELAFNRTILPHDDGWMVDTHGLDTRLIRKRDLADHLAGVDESKWLNLVIGHQHSAEKLISKGVNVAALIAECFNSLLPVYENRPPGK